MPRRRARKAARIAHAKFYASCFPPGLQREKLHESMRRQEEEEEDKQEEEEPEVVALDPEAEPLKANRGLSCPDKTFAGTCALKFDSIMRLNKKEQTLIKWIGQAERRSKL